MRVLHVEDDRRIRQAVAEELSKKGCYTQSVRGFSEAMTALALNFDRRPPDVVLTDIDLGPYGGISGGRRVVEACKRDSIPVVVLSGNPPKDIGVPALVKSRLDGDVIVQALRQAVEVSDADS